MASEEGKPAKKGGAMKIVVMALAALLLVGVGVGGSLYFTGALSGGSKGGEEEVEKEQETNSTPLYLAFPKAFTVNFETPNGLRFLQLRMEVMSYQQAAIDAVQTHMPLIKNNVILSLSNQSFETMLTTEGKEKIRADVLAEVQGTLDKYQVDAKVEEVYFTDFVMQ